VKQYRKVPLDTLTEDPNNARVHDTRNIDAIKASLTRFGQVEPLVVRKGTSTVVGGNGRIRAMRDLGWTEAEVREVELTDGEATALGIALNRTAELATWDESILAASLASLETLSFDFADVGFLPEEYIRVSEHLRAAQPAEEPEDDPLPAAGLPVAKLGDLFVVGVHRILCGDSTSADDVKRLMAGERAAVMNTDPPYGVSYDNTQRPGSQAAKPVIQNDDLRSDDLQRFLESCFANAKTHALTPNAAWYLWHAHPTQGCFAAAATAADVILPFQIIWVKKQLLLGRGQYHWRHEPCFMGWVDGHQPPDYGLGNGERTQTTVWEIDGVTQSDRKEFNHATPKPVDIFSIPIVKHTRPGQVVYEPFAGSGPQFIAAERLGRRCFGIEIEPAHVDVIVRRLERETGRKATLEAHP
jgi:DNA modification methylase